MFKKGGVEKRLRKISKQEAEGVKLLEKQVNHNQIFHIIWRYLGRTVREGSTGKRENYREKSEQSLPCRTEGSAGGGEIDQEII